MGMSMHVVGFKAPTPEFRKKAEAWRACKAAGVEPPDALEEYFEGEDPDDLGMEVEIDKARSEWRDDNSREGIVVELAKLPPGTTHVRFYCAW